MFLYQTVHQCFLTSQRLKKTHFTNIRCAQLSVVGSCGSDVIDKYKFIILSCFFCMIRMASYFLATPRLDCLTSQVSYKFIN